jgi:transcriptional regulator with XRE-family HTH domain
MSSIQEEINSYLGQAGLTEEEFLAHYGMPRRSGRYPYGSGKDPYQHSRDFLGRIEELKRKGWQETTENIKKEFGLTSTQYRLEKSICNGYRRAADVARAKSLKEDGLSTSEIGRRMGKNESSIRSLLNEEAEIRMNSARQLANDLKKIVDEKKMVDVGIDVERAVGEVSSVSNVSR